MGTKIEWTHIPGTKGETWNPIRARNKENGKIGHFCEKISPGCKNCYASTWNARGMDVSGNGLVYIAENRDKAEFFLDEKRLLEPISWRKPRSVFLESMSDLFGSWVPDEWIDRIFAVMALCPQHTFIVLTKRAKRMREYWRISTDIRDRWFLALHDQRVFPGDPRKAVLGMPSRAGVAKGILRGWRPIQLPQVWLGVSVEDQQRADERIPELLNTPAAVRFVSYEPALGPVDFKPWLPNLDWVIVGGESGHEARPFGVPWAEQVIRDCREAGVACFVKQLGARPVVCQDQFGELYRPEGIRDKKGGELSEWPEDLRVREWPAVIAANCHGKPG